MRPRAIAQASCKQEAGLKFSRICNPIPAVAILGQVDSSLVITPIAILYMAYTCVQVTLGTLFVDVYGLNDLQSGLVYLPFGIGCAMMALCTGLPVLESRKSIPIAHTFERQDAKLWLRKNRSEA